MTDHDDLRAKVLRLSEGVYGSRSLAELETAAHEAGHAIQDASGDKALVIRNMIVPAANFGSSIFFVVIMAGLLLHMVQLILLGIILSSLNVVFQLVNLSVEYDARRRAWQALLSVGLVSPAEDETVKRVLGAAA